MGNIGFANVRLLQCVLAALFSTFLYACNNGGGSSAPVNNIVHPAGEATVEYVGSVNAAEITGDNAMSLLNSVSAGSSGAQAFVDSSTVSSSGKTARISAAALGVRAKAATDTQPSVFASVTVDKTITGSVSGSATVSGALADDGTGRLNIVFQNFDDGYGTFDGGEILDIASLDPADKRITKASLTLNALTYKDATDNVTVGGTILIESPSLPYSFKEKYTENIHARDNTSGQTSKTENFVTEDTYAYGTAGLYAETLSGRVYDSVIGYVDVATPAPLSFNTYTDTNGSFTSRGILVITGASGSALRIQGLPQDKILAQLDIDGDGVFERHLVLPFSKLDMVKQANFCTNRSFVNKPNLLLSYDFDEVAGAYAFDSGDQSMHAEIYGAARVPGKRGAALQFDGSSSMVLIPTRLGMGTASFNAQFDQGMTIEAWIKPASSTNALQQVVGSGMSGSDGFIFQLNGGKLELVFNAYPSPQIIITGKQTVALDTWTYVAVTYDGSTAHTYINGVEDNSQSILFPLPKVYNNLYIGAAQTYPGIANPLSGLVDELRIWNTARTGVNIGTAYSGTLNGSPTDTLCNLQSIVAAAPVMIYNFDELSGAKAHDTSGHQFDGDIVLATRVDGKKGKALDFSTLSARVEIPLMPTTMNYDPSKLPNLKKGGVAFEAWVNLAKIDAGSTYQVIGDGFGGTKSLRLQLIEGKIELLAAESWSSNWHSIISSKLALTTNTWNHIAVTFDGTTARTYINGTKDNERTVSFVIQQPVNNWTIGAMNDFYPPWTNQLPGAIDELAVYDYALTPAEVLVHYQSP